MTKKLLSLLALLLISCAFLTGCGSDENENQTALTWQDVQVPNGIQYETINNKLPGNRLGIFVIVKDKVDGAQMEAIAKHILYEETKTNPNLYGAYVNFSDTNTEKLGLAYTLNQYEYGPNGSAGNTGDSDKSSVKKELKLVNDRNNKDWSKKPTDFDYKVYDLYMQFLHAQGGSTSGDADAINFVNKYNGKIDGQAITPKEVDKIFYKIIHWVNFS